MLALPLRLFAARPEALRVLQDSYRHVLCDEFQDVCAAQYRLLRLLAERHRNLVAVGDPRQTPVTHPLWARMLLRSLDMTDAVRASSQASQVFAALAPRDSLSYSADRFLRATGASVTGEGSGAVVTAGSSPAEVSFAIPVTQPGDYHLRARVSGGAGSPAREW